MTTFVTAADTSHGKSLCQLIRTLRQYHDERLVIWDLGLTEDDRQAVREHGMANIVLVAFPYEDYPAYFDVTKEAGEYAWKPVCVERVMDEYGGTVVWVDAGCRVDGPLTQIMEYTSEHGLYVSLTCGSVEGWTDDRCLAFLGIDKDEAQRYSMRAATLIGFDTDRGKIAVLVREWSKAAQARECIAPEGSSKRDKTNKHRQDQSVLCALLIRHGLYDALPAEQCRWNWTAHCDCDGRPRNV